MAAAKLPKKERTQMDAIETLVNQLIVSVSRAEFADDHGDDVAVMEADRECDDAKKELIARFARLTEENARLREALDGADKAGHELQVENDILNTRLVLARTARSPVELEAALNGPIQRFDMSPEQARAALRALNAEAMEAVRKSLAALMGEAVGSPEWHNAVEACQALLSRTTTLKPVQDAAELPK